MSSVTLLRSDDEALEASEEETHDCSSTKLQKVPAKVGKDIFKSMANIFKSTQPSGVTQIKIGTMADWIMLNAPFQMAERATFWAQRPVGEVRPNYN